MCRVILFGGTSEGRILSQYLSDNQIPALVCVTSRYGEMQLDCGKSVRVHTERMNVDEISELLANEQPRLVIDATHPYAAAVSQNIRDACAVQSIRCLRVTRESLKGEDYQSFPDMKSLVKWLNGVKGAIFSAIGAKEAAALTGVTDYKSRVFLRILPTVEGLKSCLSLGFPVKHIICCQGPFSKELNIAMFNETGAKILITKESGANGGFLEKIDGARVLGMQIGVLARPRVESGYSVEEVKSLIGELIK